MTHPAEGKTPKDAPPWLDADEANAWADGYNAALRSQGGSATPPSPAENSEWQPIATAPKADRESTQAISFIGWCPDETAPDGGDQRIIWWEPRMKKGVGCWWGDRDLEETPTHWKPLGPPPTSFPREEGSKA